MGDVGDGVVQLKNLIVRVGLIEKVKCDSRL